MAASVKSTSTDDHRGVSLLDVLLPYESHSSIFACLPRSSLKSLRLTCKAVNELIVSPASHLFSRVYLSIFREDLAVLNAIANHSKISRCVRELVWDTSRWTNVAVDRVDSSNPADEEEAAAYEENYRKDTAWIMAGALDFKALLCALVRLPLLKGVVLTDLMVERIGDRDKWRETVKHPAIPYESPAMRERIRRRSRVWCHGSYLPKKPADETMMHLSRVAAAFVAQIETAAEAEAEADSPGTKVQREDIGALRDIDDQRALAMLIVALQQTGTHLDSFSCLGLEGSLLDMLILKLRGRDWIKFVPCIPISLFETRTVLTDGFEQTLLPPLRRLALGLVPYDDTSPQQRTAANTNLLAALRSAVNLEVLELRGGIIDRWVHAVRADLPLMMMRSESSFPFTRLRKLVLSKFTMNRQDFEQVVLPGCFYRGVWTLQLNGCTINGAKDMDALTYWQYLVSKDITFVAAGTETESNAEEIRIEKEPNPTPWPYDDSDSDDSDYDEREYAHEEKDCVCIPFMDIDFGFDIEDSDSEYATGCDLGDDEGYDDDTYVPWKDDVRMAASALPPGSDPWQWYSKHYYDESVCAYDEEYLADTADMADVADELPAPRFDATQAWRVLGPLGADVELLFKEGDWCSSVNGEKRRGAGDRVLRLFVDSFSYRRNR